MSRLSKLVEAADQEVKAPLGTEDPSVKLRQEFLTRAIEAIELRRRLLNPSSFSNPKAKAG